MIKKSKPKTSSSLSKFSAIIFACIPCLIFFFLIFKGFGFISNIYDKKIESSKGYTEGTIFKTGSMKGSYAVAEYFVNGKRYEKQESSPAEDIQQGQRFKIKYSLNNPSIAKIIYEAPIFNLTDNTKRITGKIIQLDEYTIRFNYFINGIEFKKFQRRPANTTFLLGQSFTIEYLINKPLIAILLTGNMF